jgi:threonine/homoserine/homoserine lactone efflux protein
VDDLVALVAFAVVSTITPGPNNVLVWASAAQFGFRRTLPHMLGTAVGVCTMVLAVAAGIGAVVTSVPEIGFALKLGGSAYLLFLAYQVAGVHLLERADMARPLGILQAAAFQAVNPKAWVFAIGAITTFRPPDLPIVTGSLLVAAVLFVVALPSQAAWAAGGSIINRWITRPRARRLVSLGLAAVLAVSVLYVWL